MRNLIDLASFRRATVGLDRLFDMLENGLTVQTAETFPPFDLEQQGENRYRISIAVAGFRPDEIEVTAQQNLLTVAGRKDAQEQRSYVYNGIDARSFERRFVLGDFFQVREAELRDGLLTIELVREIPEEMKPRRIEIRGAGADGSSRLSDQRTDPAKERQQERVAA